jgi:hypothetical protein
MLRLILFLAFLPEIKIKWTAQLLCGTSTSKGQLCLPTLPPLIPAWLARVYHGTPSLDFLGLKNYTETCKEITQKHGDSLGPLS